MEITKLNINFTVSKKDILDVGLKTALNSQESGVKSQESRVRSQESALQSGQIAVQKPEPVSYKAFFAVDENKNVVIKVVDSEGRVIRQMPPEEYLKMAAAWKKVIKNLFHKEV
jgi:uncharacterized FlaG/YvyC family protein